MSSAKLESNPVIPPHKAMCPIHEPETVRGSPDLDYDAVSLDEDGHGSVGREKDLL